MAIVVDLSAKPIEINIPNCGIENICELGLSYELPFNMCFGVGGFPYEFNFELE